jgi:hypothetical protein
MRTVVVASAADKIANEVHKRVMSQPVVDVHTHLYDPAFKSLLLWGIDDLLVYHYLVAEAFRFTDIPYHRFWALSKTDQADLVWNALFLEHSPVSEACRGVLTTLQLLGLDVRKRDLPALRRWFSRQPLQKHLDQCMSLSGVRKIYMTNSPFDELERPVWEKGFRRDERFEAGLRIDPLLLSWSTTAPQLAAMGYDVQSSLSRCTFDEVRRFLEDWTRRFRARYLMISLPPEFAYPSKAPSSRLLEKAVLPHCLEHGLPLALMPGVKRAVNPELKLAGDGVGLCNLDTLRNLCAGHPDNRFLATFLARENQHEVCVLARKFRNLHLFGCWWFTNVPSLIEEITTMRLELLGLSFTPQHSDARVLDQIVYKWHHSRQVIANVLQEKYAALARTGWPLTKDDIQRDVSDLFGGAFEKFCRS